MVQTGPFRGLVYPTLQANGSELLPKLLGTYESELHEAIRSLRSVRLANIVDIGCAEGYYAIGLARLFPESTVVAFDISERARSLCRSMAQANGTGNVTVRAECTREDLLRLAGPGCHLIVSDCEGYERLLFDAEVAQKLSASFVIVELHDHDDSTTSRTVTALFRRTHTVQILTSIPDALKATRYHSTLLEGRDALEREAAFAERRGDEPTQWLFGVPRPPGPGGRPAPGEPSGNDSRDPHAGR